MLGYRLLNPSSSGQIWVLWQPHLLSITLISFTEQYVHCQVTPQSGGLSYFFTAIYASNAAAERYTLWLQLKQLAQNIGTPPWMVGGDFNEICFSSEKVGGQPAHSRRLAKFNHCISACCLQDLKATGSPFTWSNHQINRIACKLDRVMVNTHWLTTHTDSYVQFHAEGLSDHAVLQVTVRPTVPSGPRPFKYFQLWAQHTDFIDLVRSGWPFRVSGSPMYVLVKKLQHLKHIIKRWNRESFGPIQNALSHSRSTLSQAQESLMHHPTDPVFILAESEARYAYLEVLKQEEAFYR
ncbi:hypothetical protein QJS10_CPA07g00481 [Acorus calamus]|uniref:Endonuclease/exonuclease/phosphatase domain-containing protein n=1 Tax=Acorus calamus TaxID=4465 RepID=A0AAV9EEK9_ACOCL|nr:hypothetical protein QJS10_CPA07g00481 [Acorus calamus]